MKKSRILSILCILTIVIGMATGCNGKKSNREITDLEGNQVKLSNKLERIISTAPSNTEILMSLGLSDKLVAVSKYDDELPEIKDAVRLDFKSPDAETIVGLKPDIVIASGHNKTGDDDPLRTIKEAGISVVYIPSASSFEEIYSSINFISELTDNKEKGEEIINHMKSEINNIKDIAKGIDKKKKVYFEISPAPSIYTTGMGTFQNEIIETIGAVNVFGEEKGWIAPSEEAIIEKDPDVIITNVGYIEKPIDEIKNRPSWVDLNAIKNNNVYYIDKNTSSRPSNKVVEAIKEMAKKVYPEYYGD